MKKKISIVSVVVAALMVGGCSKTTEGVTGITYYPSFELETPYLVAIGDIYSEPGYAAYEGDDDITSKVSYAIYDADGNQVSSISTSECAYYTVVYSATNVDGMTGTATREVFVYDPDVTVVPSTDVTVDMDKSTYNASATYAARAAGYGKTSQSSVTVSSIGGNIYSISDLLGGWYSQIRGYGSGYNFPSYFSVAQDGSISTIYSYNAWYGAYGASYASYITSGSVMDDGSISYEAAMTSLTWQVYLQAN